ncbi:UNVERIFIED_CONTAM: AAA-ATPase [Sesamum angustifolium]|uniref:AAA-ATPase n=1 Tax=Sesamum angustifolium TaxID=2727405 RepID=A0AAW2NLD6_9LAMI
MDPNLKQAIIDDLDRFVRRKDYNRKVGKAWREDTFVRAAGDWKVEFGCSHCQLFELTLSGLLNFIDGLWSVCGDERIIIFTTNHKDRLDPALLRPGRMDMHIHMRYCTPVGFDVLALNYLGIHDHHRLFPEIKQLIEEVEITPAEVAEYLMRNEDVDLALEGLIDLLKQKKEEKIVKNKESENGKGEMPEEQSDV